ncbi:MAG: protease modulator HflC [Xanthomonadales bacterium]|jgi:membrane protease subunit HflC|nr:protease modulator HflC [Xanthomonadales bacterium]
MKSPLILILIVVLGGLGLASVFTVHETEHALRFQLGRIVKTDYEPGLHFKVPFVNNIRKFDNRVLTLDTQPQPMITSEQKFLEVDSFVKWRITDVSRFYTATQGNEAIALNRLNDIIEDRLRSQIASRTLVEVVSEERVSTMQDIASAANAAAQEFGIDVVDVRIKSIELPDDVRTSVFQRMSADRQKEATRLRFEGREEAERIRSSADREAQVILAEGERDGQRLRGEGDAQSIGIYADAYGMDEEFYAFSRSLQAYRNAFEGRDVMVVDPSSEFFDYFGGSGTDGNR